MLRQNAEIVSVAVLWVLTPCSLEGVPKQKRKNVKPSSSGYKLCGVTELLSKWLLSWPAGSPSF
jgi:hypothetical protein